MNEINLIKQNNQVVVSSRQIAESFSKEHKTVIRSVEDILTSAQNCANLFFESTLPDSYGREQKTYFMNRDGFTLLAMGFTGKKAMTWKLKYIEAFNEMEAQLRQPKTQLEILAESALILVEQEKQLKQLAAAQEAVKQEITETKQEIQDMRDIVALNPHEWREETTRLIVSMANRLGGYSFISNLRNESYEKLDERLGIRLHIRLHNKKRLMGKAGATLAKIKATNCLDVIADDKKLQAGYIAIVKEMAIRYKAA